MTISKDCIRTAREAFRKARIMLLAQLTALLHCSRRSAQRRLAEWGALTSYSHNSRYYALPGVARFDENGIWRCEGVLFSSVGTLKRTVPALVDASDKGLTAAELTTRLHLDAGRFLRQWADEKLFVRERHEGGFLHFSADPGKARRQRQLRLASLGHKPGFLPDAVAVPVLLARLHHPTANMSDLARILSSQGLALTSEDVEDFLRFHGLQKNTRVH